MKQVTYKIAGMSCTGCVGSVKRALERQHAITEAAVSLDSNEAKVRYDESLINDEKVITLIQNLGYEAEVK